MKRAVLFLLLLLNVVVIPSLVRAENLPPVVSTEWLEKNLADADLRVIDIRKIEEFKEGHIPGAVNVFYGTWAVKQGGLDNELPADDDLADIVVSAGLDARSKAVVVGIVDSTTDQVNMTRIAWTLAYAGVGNVAVLDGGYKKWQAEKRAVSMEPAKARPAAANLKQNGALKAPKALLLEKGRAATVVDVRLPEFYFGAAKIPIVDRAGRLQGAVNLPAAWIFTKEGMYKPTEELKAMAQGVLGADTAKPIIVYCDTGRLASGWWFVLAKVLGYSNVKLYDGSFQELAKDPATPVAKYSWM